MLSDQTDQIQIVKQVELLTLKNKNLSTTDVFHNRSHWEKVFLGPVTSCDATRSHNTIWPIAFSDRLISDTKMAAIHSNGVVHLV